MPGRATAAAEARAAEEADDGPGLAIVLRERTGLVRRRAGEAYPRTRETRESHTAGNGYHAGSPPSAGT